jgi:hypothetical protein
MNFLCKTITGALTVMSINVFAGDANKFDYFGIGFQNNSYDNLNFSPQLDTSTLTPLIYDEKTSSRGFRGFVGHQFNRYLAIESGVTSFGKASFSVTDKETDSDGKITTKIEQNGRFKTLAADVRIIGTYPLSDKLFLKAHIGALAWDNEFTFLTGEATALTKQKNSDSGVSLLAGLGVGYGFNSKIAFSFDFEKTEIAELTTKNIVFSLLVRF